MANRIKGITVEIGGDTTNSCRTMKFHKSSMMLFSVRLLRQKSSIIADAIRSIGTLCRIVWCGKYYSKRRKR